MLRWLTGGIPSITTDSRDENTTDSDAATSFPAPGSIQRVGISSTPSLRVQEEESNDEDNDEEHRKVIADLDLFISPPSHVQAAPATTINNATRLSNASQSKNDEFKAPSFSMSITSPSTTVSSTSTAAVPLKSKPKPPHRPFPPEQPASSPSSLSNGRVTLSNSNKSLGSSLGLPPSTTVKPRKQRFVALEPGYSPLDWARLNKEGDDYELRCGFDKPQKFTMTEVSEHATKTDAWSVFHGRVYNITPYLHFHPGGVPELMRVAGKDGTELFMQTHGWVNAELMMEGCLIGVLVRE